MSSGPVQTQLHSQSSCGTKMETVIPGNVFHHVAPHPSIFPGLPIPASFPPRSFLCSRSTRAFMNPDPWKTNQRKPTQIHQLKWKAIYPEQELTPLLADEWCWSLEPKEAATRETFDNAAFMGAQHKGHTVSRGGALPCALICGPGAAGAGWPGILNDARAGWVPGLGIGGVSFQCSEKRCCESLLDCSSFEEFSLKECPRIFFFNC